MNLFILLISEMEGKVMLDNKQIGRMSRGKGLYDKNYWRIHLYLPPNYSFVNEKTKKLNKRIKSSKSKIKEFVHHCLNFNISEILDNTDTFKNC